ncbi:MAG: HDOD domain-containing protein [Acidobacteria bacterium]|nr:HDOD domain-containing protein [Acidobacteriota bacterium]
MVRFIARQPIFDRKLGVVAYELLFRSDLDNYCKGIDADAMSSSVINDSMLLFDIDQLTDGRGAFINVGRKALLQGYASLLPARLVTVEILETVEPDDAVIDACQKLKKDGYRIALDDFVDRPEMDRLVALADCLKIDVLTTPPANLKGLVARRRRPGLRLLAEKVETHEVFRQTAALGFELFQGFFFEKPVVLSRKDVPGFKLNYLRLLKEMNDGSFNLDRIEHITKQDVSISYKLLRYINSAGFGLRNRVSSIREALFLLGEDNIRKLVTLWALAGLGQEGPSELIVTSVTRARLCEALAPATEGDARRSEAYLLGVFSLIDVVVGQPMSTVVGQLPISDDVRAGLVEHSGRLRPILDCVEAYERGDWAGFSARAQELGIDEAAFPDLYNAALAGTSELIGQPRPRA